MCWFLSLGVVSRAKYDLYHHILQNSLFLTHTSGRPRSGSRGTARTACHPSNTNLRISIGYRRHGQVEIWPHQTISECFGLPIRNVLGPMGCLSVTLWSPKAGYPFDHTRETREEFILTRRPAIFQLARSVSNSVSHWPEKRVAQVGMSKCSS